LRREKPLPKKESLSLDTAATHILEECRMVLPGIQALFGFQLIAVFNQSFAATLSAGEQQLHFTSTVFTVIAIALVMAPAALHRQIDPLAVTDRFIHVSSNLLLLSMLPLALSICMEVYLIARAILHSMGIAIFVSLFAFVLFLGLWVALPWKEASTR
jgi:uncharacterized protein DUF6328